mmetsp:Transcript_9185/g.9255  ORF Transcript_9185/g.9255 Transcript_9185/m.9255 type:complete len:482 (+) Transcript_9185:343-1788(+)
MLLFHIFLILQCAITSFSADVSSDYFYIYTGEEWGNISTASLFKRDRTEKHLDRMENGGAGVVMNEVQGLYHTDQYQLFEVFYNRARKDLVRRTKDPDKATTFIIPYDFSSDVAFFNSCPRSKDHICFTFRKCPLAPKVEELLRNSKYYTRHHGHDHLILVGMNYAMDHYILKPRCKAFLSGVCGNCTKLAIDDYSFLYGEPAEAVGTRGDHWAAVPFPGDFHWNHKIQRPFPWETLTRPVFISYLGSTQSYYGPARKLRHAIVHYCKLHTQDCEHHTYSANGTRSNLLVQGHNPHGLSTRSVFCFQPIGDLMTRKGLFDGILQGCIPVVFSCLTASCMYTWHWEESFWKSVVIEFDMDLVLQRRLDPIQALKELAAGDASFISSRQQRLRDRVFELQYSLVGFDEIARKGLDKNSSWPLDKNNFNGRMRDAYDIGIDHVLGWHSGKETRVRNATSPHCWNGMLNSTAVPSVCVPLPKSVA